jgi:RNA polymerase sigma-70 factor (ECF subfamily)
LPELVARAREAWPGVEVAAREFASYLSERLPDDEHLETSIARAHIDDLYLACACARRNPHALAEFEQRFLPDVAAYVATVDASPAFADEVRQILRKKLFVSDGESRAKIMDFGGRGPLGGWLRIVAIRTARDLKRSQNRHHPGRAKESLQIRSSTPDPELQLVKARYGREFRIAFETTLSSLAPRDRNVLSLYFLEGMTSNEIAALYQVSGAAVRLWLKRSRGTILSETRRLLGDRLGMKDSELQSLMYVVQSQLDVSISRFLKKTEP